MKLRPWTPTIDPTTIPDQVLQSEIGRRNSAKRKTFGAGPGRPSKGGPRCACGKYALASARKYHHHCPRLVEVRVEGNQIFYFPDDPVETLESPAAGRASAPTAICPTCGRQPGSNPLLCFECQLERRRVAIGGF